MRMAVGGNVCVRKERERQNKRQEGSFNTYAPPNRPFTIGNLASPQPVLFFAHQLSTPSFLFFCY